MSQSDISLISPKIEGYIKEVRVQDNEHVKAGQMLFVIDDSDFAAKVAQAKPRSRARRRWSRPSLPGTITRRR